VTMPQDLDAAQFGAANVSRAGDGYGLRHKGECRLGLHQG